MNEKDIEKIVERKVREEVAKVFNVEKRTTAKTRRGTGRQMVRRSVSVPPELWDRIEALAGSASSHVVNALEMYLSAIEKPKR